MKITKTPPALLLVSAFFAALCFLPNPAGAEPSWGVHVASFRSPVGAIAGWQEVLHKYPDVLASLAQNYIPVDIPGKGRFTRVIAGMFGDRSQALELARALRKRGAYADVLPLVVEKPTGAATPAYDPGHVPAPVAPRQVAVAPVKKVQQPVAPLAESSKNRQSAPARTAKAAPASPEMAPPVVAKVKAPAAPSLDSKRKDKAEGLAAGDGVPMATAEVMAQRVKVLAKGMNQLHKYVPGPVRTTSRKGVDDEQVVAPVRKTAKRKAAPANAPRAGFKDKDSIAEDGLTLATPRKDMGRISAQYGDMTKEYEEQSKLAPTAPEGYRKDMMPYLGLGIHF